MIFTYRTFYVIINLYMPILDHMPELAEQGFVGYTLHDKAEAAVVGRCLEVNPFDTAYANIGQTTLRLSGVTEESIRIAKLDTTQSPPCVVDEREIELQQPGYITVGKDPSNDWIITDDPKVNALHLVISRTNEGGALFFDRNSSNGTVITTKDA